MSSPILELQQNVLDQEVPVSTLLRYALLLATRLKDQTMVNWCSKELNGYDTAPEAPYRIAYGEYMATDTFGQDVPVEVRNPRALEIISKVPLFMSVTEIENSLAQANENTAFKMFLPAQLEADQKSQMRGVHRLFRKVQKEALAHVLSAVRNKIFDWTIELESKDVKVNGEFPQLPTAKRKTVAAPRSITATNYVEVKDALKSPFQVGTTHSAQIANYEDLDLAAVEKLLASMEDELKGKQQDEIGRKLLEEVLAVKHLLESPTPKHSWIRDGLETIKHVLEHAAGSVLSHALTEGQYLAQIGRILGMG